ncbi:MAG: exo-beta-N-acetylmuramidase NamZ domain-containing protein [Gemmatimonadales bacterium]
MHQKFGVAFVVMIAGAGACAPSRPMGAPAPVAAAPGIDVLVDDSFALIRARRVGLITNLAGVDAHGTSDAARLRAAGVDLVALFSPEHGFRGTADPGAAVGSTTDSATGLPIYSLYGPARTQSEGVFGRLDLILVDLQDAGARYFTYLATTVNVMRAAAAAGRPVVILDRPDPIGGAVQGNVLDTAFSSDVGLLAVPMRPGMTLGELARLARSDLGLTTDLRVVPVRGWHRAEAFDATGLPFVPPSPNLPTLESLFHYPGLCLFEGTDLSVGRGSDAPFEQIGAPWLDTVAVLARIRAESLPGVEFRGVTFTPRHPGDEKYADTLLAGIRLHVTDRARYDPTSTAVHLLAAVRASAGDRFAFLPRQFDRLAGGSALRLALLGGEAPDAIVASWGAARDQFLARRTPFLLYP